MDPWQSPRRSGLSNRSRSYVALLATLVATLCLLTLDLVPGSSRLRSLVGLENGGAAVVDGDGSYRFFASQAGQPVSWDPCEPIRYVVNPEDAPDDWEDLVEDSVAVMSEASGIEFQYEGTTDDRNFTDRFDVGSRPEPVLVGWATEDEVSELAGDVAGVGGPVSRSRAGFTRYVSGMVALDVEAFDAMDTPFDEGAQQAVLMHEIGHLLGLDHVDDPQELMYESNLGRTSLGEGDLEGLSRLGAVPCG